LHQRAALVLGILDTPLSAAVATTTRDATATDSLRSATIG
jgi:hypothetical protein